MGGGGGNGSGEGGGGLGGGDGGGGDGLGGDGGGGDGAAKATEAWVGCATDSTVTPSAADMAAGPPAVRAWAAARVEPALETDALGMMIAASTCTLAAETSRRIHPTSTARRWARARRYAV